MFGKSTNFETRSKVCTIVAANEDIGHPKLLSVVPVMLPLQSITTLSYNNSVIRDLEKMYYNEGLYEDNFDIFGKEHNARQFYTMPVNSIVNDQGSFAEWCYKRPPTCKEGNGIQCSVNLASAQDTSGGPGNTT
jgi:hypothetical protein